MRLLLDRVPQMQRLAVFEAVGRQGSFTAAAADLGISQPAVSKHITTLETQLGFLLFHRRSNRIELTGEGSALFQVLTTSFDQLEAVLSDLKQATERLIIASQPSVAGTWLAPRLRELQDFMAPCEVSVLIFDRDPELDGVDYDVAIRAEARDLPGHRSQKLIPEVVVPVAAPELAAKLGLDASSPAEALLDAPLLDIDRIGRPWMTWQGWFAGHGIKYTPPESRIIYDSYSSLTGQAISGNGIALSWRYLRSDLIERGLLVEVGAEVHDPTNGHFLVWPNALHRDHRLRSLREWFRGVLPAHMFTDHG